MRDKGVCMRVYVYVCMCMSVCVLLFSGGLEIVFYVFKFATLLSWPYFKSIGVLTF